MGNKPTSDEYPDTLGTVEHLDPPPDTENSENPVVAIVSHLIFTTDSWKRLLIRTILISQVSTLFFFFYTLLKHPESFTDALSSIFQGVFPRTLKVEEGSEAVRLLKEFKAQKDVVAIGINAYSKEGLDVKLWVEPGDYFRDRPWDMYSGLGQDSITRKVFHESGECYNSKVDDTKMYISCPLENVDGTVMGYLWVIYQSNANDTENRYLSGTKIITRYIKKILL